MNEAGSYLVLLGLKSFCLSVEVLIVNDKTNTNSNLKIQFVSLYSLLPPVCPKLYLNYSQNENGSHRNRQHLTYQQV